jgi:hypothetical protein
MSFTLTNGAATKVVEAEWQKDELIQRGWHLKAGGTAGTATDIHNFTNPTPKDFKGVGFAGETPGSFAYAAKAATEGATQPQYEALADIANKYGDMVPDAKTYTKGIETVATLPSTGDAAKVYLLTVKDTAKGTMPGAYVYKDSKWTEYTA